MYPIFYYMFGIVRQQQYFEQRRRQQQKQTAGSDNCLEDNVCTASNSERKSLDVLSLKTLSTAAQESDPRCLNGEETSVVSCVVCVHIVFTLKFLNTQTFNLF